MTTNNPNKPSCEERIADDLVNMVQEGMDHLSPEEQDRRLTEFCEAVSALPHIPTTGSEWPEFVRGDKAARGPSSAK